MNDTEMSALAKDIRRSMHRVAAEPSNVDDEIDFVLSRLRSHDIRLLHELLAEIRQAVANDSRAKLDVGAPTKRRARYGR